MKIIDYELFEVPPRWLFLKLSTEDGRVGWGEPIVEGLAKTVRSATSELIERHVLGENPFDIEKLWQQMYRGNFYRGGPILMSAISGIDQALWDIKGKEMGVPAYDLLGGKVREKIQVYQWIGGDEPSELESDAEEKVDAGFKALKMNATSKTSRIEPPAFIDKTLNRISKVREAVGDKISIGIDFHGRIPKTIAKTLASRLEQYEPMFIEEPVRPENNEAIKDIASHTETPIATGERMFSRWDFKNLLEEGSVDIVQPDLSHAGGISEVRRIASMAEAHDIGLAPHCPLGPIALASCIQVDAIARNAIIQEQSLNIHYNKENDLLDYLSNPEAFEFQNGYVKIPESPGLGVEIREDYVREKAKENVDWHNPIWHHEDGRLAEW